MPNPYYPNASVPSVGASSASFLSGWMPIVTSTATSPIVLTVTAHGLSTGDCVEVCGHAQYGANGTWQIIVQDANDFTLVGSTTTPQPGNLTGNVRTIAVDPSFTLPNDGTDFVQASSVNAPLEGSTNTIPWLYERTGKYRLVDIYEADNRTDPPTPWNSINSPVTLVFYDTPYQLLAIPSATLFSTYSNPPGLRAGDVLDVVMVCSFVTQSSASAWVPPQYSFEPQIFCQAVGGAGTITFPIIESLQDRALAAQANNYLNSIPMHGHIFIPQFSIDYTSFNFFVYAQHNGGSGPVVDPISAFVAGLWQCKVHHYRRNG